LTKLNAVRSKFLDRAQIGESFTDGTSLLDKHQEPDFVRFIRKKRNFGVVFLFFLQLSLVCSHVILGFEPTNTKELEHQGNSSQSIVFSVVKNDSKNTWFLTNFFVIIF